MTNSGPDKENGVLYIPFKLLKDKTIKPNVKLYYLHLKNSMDSGTKKTRQNIESLAIGTGFAKSTIIEFNKELEKNEYISIFKLPYYIREKGYKVFKNSYIFKNAGRTAWVTRYFLDNGNTTQTEKNLIMLLLPYKDEDNQVKMSNPKIAAATGLAIRTVNPTIASLAKKCYAKKIDRVTLFLDMDKIMDKEKDIASKEPKIKQSETKSIEDLPPSEATIEPEAISVDQDLPEIEYETEIFETVEASVPDEVTTTLEVTKTTPKDTLLDSGSNDRPLNSAATTIADEWDALLLEDPDIIVEEETVASEKKATMTKEDKEWFARMKKEKDAQLLMKEMEKVVASWKIG